MPPPKDPIRRAQWIEERRISASQYRHTPERKRKIGASKEGIPRPDVAERNKNPEFISRRIESRKNNGEDWTTDETKKKISTTLTGRPVDVEKVARQVTTMLAKNGGKYSDWRGCPAYYKWSKEVKTRDNFTCQHCGMKEEEFKEAQKQLGVKRVVGLHAHHIKNGEKYPELRYVVSNGLALCPYCHGIEETRLYWLEVQEKILEVRKSKLIQLRPITNKIA